MKNADLFNRKRYYCFRSSIRVQKRLFRGSKARFEASRACLWSHQRAWIEFFNRLTTSQQLHRTSGVMG
jgi:hypothetical protein